MPLLAIQTQRGNPDPEGSDADLGCGMSWVMNQSCMVTLDRGCDLTDGTQNDTSCENRSAGMLIPAMLSDNQCSVLFKEDDQC